MFGKYKGVLLSASGQDANSRVFPIAFAVRNVNDKFKGLQQKAMVGRAGDEFRVSEFKEIMELIKLTD
ncbi:unnamed protein product [Brassica napus]|uniref:(rape) hypothetical protein n=1 Tax=Brassica napus TaxID=3708 RepID=A0A816LK89_BRANA|nr:unnamed protein product [Brassica napus]